MSRFLPGLTAFFVVALAAALMGRFVWASLATTPVTAPATAPVTAPATAPATAPVTAPANAPVLPSAGPTPGASSPAPSTLAAQNEALFQQLQAVHGLSESQMKSIRAIFARSTVIGQGNSAITRHPVTVEACLGQLEAKGIQYENPAFEKICGGPYMAPLYGADEEKHEDTDTCIDQFEFPDIPCAYPVVWVRAKEAAEICEVMGKRLCDAHEWEGACAGSLEPPDYNFALAKGQTPSAAVRRMRDEHNRRESGRKSWSYGPEYRAGVCAASSTKSEGCDGGNWSHCGSNTFPSGYFPECHSRLEVYDLNGNAAEHMNLPLDETQMSSRGSKTLGVTEMKGSWFIWDTYRAHEDWCRWRAPFWHGGRVMDPDSHHNYHLGFRCCKTIGGTSGG